MSFSRALSASSTRRGVGDARRLLLRRSTCAAIVTAAMLGPSSARATDVVVDPLQLQQRIDGFGASSAWTDQAMSDSDSDLAFSVDAGIGLSLLRVRIAPDGSCLEVVTAQKAQLRGAKVWATPWSPPAQWKTNDDVNDGGTLLPDHYDDWAQTLVHFVRSMNDSGVQLAGVSAQNEPAFVARTYESCIYTPATLTDFIANHMGPAFADAGLVDSTGQPLKIIAPETQGWDEFPQFKVAIQGSATATSALTTLASHSYNGTPTPDPSIAAANLSFWETEVSDPNKTQDPTITSGLWVATTMHQALVNANVNAWHYWWIYPTNPDNSALWNLPEGGPPAPSKRFYVMGNFSRFVRPGFVRIGATASPVAGVLTSAYYDAPSSTVVIVAINSNTSPVQQTFQFANATTGSWASWVTSATSNLAPGDAITGADPFTYALQAQSVTTLEGRVTSIADAGAVTEQDAGVADATVDGAQSASSTPASPGCGLACSAAGRSSERTGSGYAAACAIALFGASRRRSRRPRIH